MNSMNLQKILSAGAGGLLIAVLCILFVFPTKDTQSESRAAIERAQVSLANLVYNNAALSDPDTSLDAEEAEMLNMINPKSGQNFTEAELKRLKHLRTKFPDNLLIPGPKSEEQIQHQKQTDAQLEQMAARFNAGNASRGDIDGYFDHKNALLDDWVELLDVVVNQENWSPDVRDKYARMLKNTEKIRQRNEKQRKAMLERNGFK